MEGVQAVRFKATRQELKAGTEMSVFRREMRKRGITFGFYNGFFWIIPIEGRRPEDQEIEDAYQEYFGKQQTPSLVQVEDWHEDGFWNNVGVVTIRDALQAALRSRFTGAEHMIIKGCAVYDKSCRYNESPWGFAALGISLGRIYRIGNSNVALDPMVAYDAYDNRDRWIEERYERHRYITPAARCSALQFSKRLDIMSAKVFPLELSFSNAKLKFEGAYYEIALERKEKQGLEQWF